MSWARVHRWLAIVLVIPLAVWSVTGLLFHLKPGWSRAYDQLDAERAGPLPHEVLPIAALGLVEARRVELFSTALGPLYRVTTPTGTELFDAATGRRRSPLTADDVRTLALDAVARSPHRGTYGDVAGVDLTEASARVRFARGISVEIGRDDARLSQRGDDTDRIDWLYRIHYLQWTGNKLVDRMLGVAGLALIWAVLLPGLVLFVRRLRG